MSDLKFRPVQGTESNILNSQPHEGYVYFATDTKRIYMSHNGDFLPMGGNSGIHYGKMVLDYKPDSDQIEFDFLLDDIEGNEKLDLDKKIIPNIDDLILNIPDGCFYRVEGIEENINSEKIIKTIKLTIAGSGGSGGTGGGSTIRLVLTDFEKSFNKYYTLEDENFIIKYNLSYIGNAENNFITSIVYKLKGEEIGSEYEKDFGDFEFDLEPFLKKLSTSTTNTLEIMVIDSYGTQKTFYYYINLIELKLEDNNDSVILFNYYNEQQNYIPLRYRLTPYGGSKLNNKEILYEIYDKEYNLIDTLSKSLNTMGSTVENDIDFKKYGHGVYFIESYIHGIVSNSNKNIYSNKIVSQIIYFDAKINTTLLAAHNNKFRVEQYNMLSIPYMVGNDPMSGNTTANISTSITSISTQEEKINTLSVNINETQTWDIYFDTIDRYILQLTCNDQIIDLGTIEVVAYEGDLPVINNEMLQLNLSAINRSNNELNKEEWTYKNYTSTLSNFKWGNINGWMKDEDDVGFLKLSSGATMEVDNYYPFEKDAANNGLTIELDFKVSGVLDYSKTLMSCLSYTSNGDIHVGYHVTGQTSTMNSSLIKATGGEIIEGDDEEDQIYNTAIQGLTARFTENERIHLTWVIEKRNVNSDLKPLVTTYLNGVVSGMTQYGSTDQFLQINSSPAKIKFDSTYADIDIYNIRVYDTALDGRAVLNNFMATFGSNEERQNIYKDNLLVDEAGEISLEKIENGDYTLKIPYVKLTGGSSLNKWIVTNEAELGGMKLIYRLPQAKKDYRLMKYEYIDPLDNSKNITEDIELTNPTTGEIVYAAEDAPIGGGGFEVTKGCQVYGQGTSSMEYPVKNLRIKFKNNKIQIYEKAYPVNLLCFKADYMESSGSHNTGTANLIYNLYSNIKLKTPPQEFYNSENWGYDVVTAIRGYPVIIFYSPTGEEGSYEFVGKYNLNMDKATHEPFGFVPYPKEYDFNATKTFGWDKDGKETIHCFEFLNNSSNLANFRSEENENFEESFYKMVTNDDGDLVQNWTKSYESRYPEDRIDNDVISSFFRMANWVNSTENDLDKFKREFNEYFDLNFTTFYYVLTHILLMIDSRAKNMMMATWDDKKWYPIFYDMDTMLGLNNYGYNKFNYNAEDTQVGLYNGENSIFWNNFKQVFISEITAMYRKLRDNGLTYISLLNTYNISQADAWNEALCNADAKYKYIRPFMEDYYDGTNDTIIPAGTKNYLYAGQGRRSMHRQWWLSNRLNFFDGKYLADNYKNDKFTMRLYTSTKSGTGEEGKEDWELDERTQKSYEVVPPNSSFTITPLQDQYLTVAPGGDNGINIGPFLTKANTPRTFEDNQEYIDTETYIYGASLLKDIGDVSDKYFGKFEISAGICRLENLILGNANNDYYNKNFGDLKIGESLPYLKYLNIMNCEGLRDELNLKGSTRLERVLATGTKITSVDLASYGILKELRLPSTISTFIIDNYSELSNNNFTIGTCDYDAENKIFNYTNDFSNIVTLSVKNTPIDTYSIIKNTNNINQYQVTDFIWRITDLNDVTLGDDGLLNKINILEKLLKINPYKVQTHAQALSGKIILAIPGLKADELNVYNQYITKYPNVKITYDLDAIGSEGDILLAYDISFKNGSDEIYWSKKTNKDIDITFFNKETSPDGELIIPIKASTASHHFDFYGWKTPTGEEFLSTENDILALNDIINYINSIEDLTENIIFTPLFKERIRTFTVTFKDEDKETILLQKECDYGTTLTPPIEIFPYKDSSDLALDMVWAFDGFYDRLNNKLDKVIVASNLDYFARYTKKSVYENVIDSKYITINSNNEIVWNIPKDRSLLKGKITLPLIDGKNIIMSTALLQDNNDEGKITHLFFQKKNPASFIFKPYTINWNKKLTYVELPKNTIQLNAGAINGSEKLEYIGPPLSEDDYKKLPSKPVIYLPNTITLIGHEAFGSNGNFEEVILGDEHNKWTLENIHNISHTAMDGSSSCNKVTIYCSSDLTDLERDILSAAFETNNITVL